LAWVGPVIAGIEHYNRKVVAILVLSGCKMPT